jgi:peptidyl-prolyl cis-trans isomerase B (cyclophilin B)
MITFKTNYGDFVVKLHQEKTPVTAANFVEYIKNDFYKGTIFHRVIPGFMIQGGGFEPGMVQKQTRQPIENEAMLGGSNKRGTLAMARTNDPHSASSQFFINLVDNTFLDYKKSSSEGFGYCVFGEVIEGMDVIDTIARCKTGSRMGHQDVPLDDVVVTEVIVKAE